MPRKSHRQAAGRLQSTGPQRVGRDLATKQQQGHKFQKSKLTEFYCVKNIRKLCKRQGVPVVEGKSAGFRLLVLPAV